MIEAVLITPDGFFKIVHAPPGAQSIDVAGRDVAPIASIPPGGTIPRPYDAVARRTYQRVRYWVGPRHEPLLYQKPAMFAEDPSSVSDSVIEQVLRNIGALEEQWAKPSRLQVENKLRRKTLGLSNALDRGLNPEEESIALDIYEESGQKAAEDWLNGK